MRNWKVVVKKILENGDGKGRIVGVHAMMTFFVRESDATKAVLAVTGLDLFRMADVQVADIVSVSLEEY
jgi:hypothetical protein